MHRTVIVLLALVLAGQAQAAEPRLESIAYPFPVKSFTFASQQQDLDMSYMDVPARGPTRGTVLLLHGKNFSGTYWEETATALSGQGYRVVIPDQIGFGKSSKPARYQFSFHQLAANTRSLLTNLNVTEVHVVGHSMGGMLATRMALLFPETVRSLTLVNPIGLEDWQMKGVPYQTPDQWYQQEFKQTAERIREYQKENYYHGTWEPRYERWVEQSAAALRSPDYSTIAWNQALAYEMIFTQPVCHEFGRLKVPTLLIIGQKDRTAVGSALVSKNVRGTLGDYPKLGRAAALAISNATLAELDDVGHVPHIENFSRFIEPLKTFLASRQ